MPSPEDGLQVIRNEEIQSEELYHDGLGHSLVNCPDETHLLHGLKVEIMELVHDLCYLFINLLPSY